MIALKSIRSIIGCIIDMNLITFLIITLLVTCYYIRKPAQSFNWNSWLLRGREWEQKGEIYQKIFKVKKWKGYLIELSDIDKTVFPKKHITNFSQEYLIRYLQESCKAEMTHWAIIFSMVFYLFFKNLRTYLIMLCLASVLNMPYIIIQRYNRPRILHMLEKMKQSHSTEYIQQTPVTVGSVG